jgi:hypothetical protein
MPERLKIFASSYIKIYYLTATGQVLVEQFKNPYVGNPSSSHEMTFEEFCKHYALYTASAVLAARACGREVEVTLV